MSSTNTKPLKKIFNVEGMDCASCAMVIESDLEDNGIKAKCDFVNQTLEVELTSQNQENTVKDLVKKSGYSLTL